VPETEFIRPDWPAPSNVRALQTTRAGGASVGSYKSLNLALHVGDDADVVQCNRRSVVEAFELPAEPVWLEQVHGIEVVELDHSRPQMPPKADGAVTSVPGIVCCVMTADCLPVFLCDAAGTRVGIAHAGWRGLANGVIETTVAAMGYGAGGSLFAWLGPAISQPAFEVGPEVRAAFVARDAAAVGAFVPNPNGRWQADLYALARAALGRVGVTEIHGGDFCTHRDARRFFSHRREAPCGRMASLIWLTAA
jgi:YfiH family protein